MPTPGERKALIFLASLAALGVTARGWREWKAERAPVLASGGEALARQIEAVDSAVAAGGGRRPRAGARGPKGADTLATSRGGARASGRRRTDPLTGADASGAAATGRRRGLESVQPPEPAADRDPRAAYRRRVAREDSARWTAAEWSADAEARAASAIRARDQARRRELRAFTAGGAVPLSPARPSVDLDIADVSEIERLPYVSGVLARVIVADRAVRGPFGSIEGLRRVRGVGERLAERLQPLVTFSLAPRQGSAVESRSRVSGHRGVRP